MRLVIIAHVFGFNDGQGRVNFEVAQAAVKAGLQVTLVGQSCDDVLLRDGCARFVQFERSKLPTQSLKNISFALRSARWLRNHRHEFDLIQANGFITWGAVDIVAAHFVHSAWLKHPNYPFRSLKRPYQLYQRLHTIFNAWQERKVYRQAKKVIAVSRKTAREVEALGLEPSRVVVIYNGVDVDAFHPGVSERAHFGLPQDLPLAAFVGDLRTPRKNLDVVLNSMKWLPFLQLVVAGDTDGSRYPDMTKQLGIADRVHFIGKTTEVARMMRSVDLFILPSRYEAHPLVVMEAMASGLPVIASSGIAALEDFRDKIAILEDHEDPIALAGIIAGLLESPSRMRALGSAACDFAKDMTWGNTASKYLEVYEEVLGSPSRIESSLSKLA